ncbi:hypothetical protein PIROE2DRAFT_20060, partial [Piromyces sp. E2]
MYLNMYVDNIYKYTVYILTVIYYCQAVVVTTQTTELFSEPQKIINFKTSNNLIYYGKSKKNNTLAISFNNGVSWENIQDIGNENVMDVVKDSLDENELYAITKNSIYHSVDSGSNWTSINYEFDIIKNTLLFNQENNQALILGRKCNVTCTRNV